MDIFARFFQGGDGFREFRFQNQGGGSGATFIHTFNPGMDYMHFPPNMFQRQQQQQQQSGRGNMRGLYEDKSSVITLTSNTWPFNSSINKQKDNDSIWLVEFYSIQCVHCRNFVQSYEKIANELKGKIKVAAINCDIEMQICTSNNIRSLPTIKLYKFNEWNTPQLYTGTRDIQSIVTWAKNSIPTFVSKQKPEEIRRILIHKPYKPHVIFFTSKYTNNEQNFAVNIAARSVYKELPCYLIEEPDISNDTLQYIQYQELLQEYNLSPNSFLQKSKTVSSNQFFISIKAGIGVSAHTVIWKSTENNIQTITDTTKISDIISKFQKQYKSSVKNQKYFEPPYIDTDQDSYIEPINISILKQLLINSQAGDKIVKQQQQLQRIKSGNTIVYIVCDSTSSIIRDRREYYLQNYKKEPSGNTAAQIVHELIRIAQDYNEIKFYYMPLSSTELIEYIRPYIDDVIFDTMRKVCDSSIFSISSRLTIPPLIPLSINAKRGRYSYLLNTIESAQNDDGTCVYIFISFFIFLFIFFI